MVYLGVWLTDTDSWRALMAIEAEGKVESDLLMSCPSCARTCLATQIYFWKFRESDRVAGQARVNVSLSTARYISAFTL